MAESTAEAGTETSRGPEQGLLELFAELAEGRTAALEPLYDELSDEVHGLALWRTGSGADAADVLQEVFVKLAQAYGVELGPAGYLTGWVPPPSGSNAAYTISPANSS